MAAPSVFSPAPSLAGSGAARARAVSWPAGQGALEERAANAPLSLDDPRQVYFVEAGSVDVFSVPESGADGLGGARRHLWTASEGEALFGFERRAGARAHVLVAVCAPGTRLRRIALADVEAMARADVRLFEALAEGLVSRLAAAMVRRPELDVLLKEGETTTLEAGKTTGVLGGLVWARHEAGTSLFAGMPDVVVGPSDPPLPLYKGMWLLAQGEEVKIGVTDSAACLASGAGFEGMTYIRSLFGTVAALVAAREEQDELDRLARKARSEREMRQKGLAGLAAVLGEMPLEASLGGDESPLLRACRVVAEQDGIVLRPPPSWEMTGRVRDPLAAICRASRVRSRRVTLRGEWWNTDSGHLLGFVEKTETPVALLRRPKGGYDMLDPAEMTRTPVDAKVAATLNWESYTFYRPLPDQPIQGRGLVSRIAEEARPELRFIVIMAVCAGLLTLLVPIATKRMLGDIVPNALKLQVWSLGLALAGVQAGIALFNLTRAFTLARVEGRSNASLQAAVVDRMLALPVPFFRDNPVGELAGRALSVNAARAVLTGSAAVSVLAGISSILYFILLVYYNWRLALLALVIMLLSLWLVVSIAKKAARDERENLSVQGKVNALVYQMINGIAKLRVAAAEGRLFSLWAALFKQNAELNYRARHHKNVIKVFNGQLSFLSSLLLFGVAGYLVRNGHELDTATFVAFNAAFGALFGSLTQLSDTVVSIMAVSPIIERAGPILETVPEVQATKPDPGSLTGRIEAFHLRFGYKKDGPLVLDDVSLHAMPGEYVAVVGPSGSGKSTTFRMLLGFERPDSGVIYYDGQDLGSVDLSGVRSQVGVVLQNSRLIKGSVFDNIVGSAPLSMEDAWAAAAMAGLEDEIREMPMGMHTVVAEGGANLSGGQQQRLLIARALVRKPRILYFDEATSALDNRVQEQVTSSLDRLNATRIVIAHRLSTIRNADRIYVMDKGKVVQAGGFDELAGQPGLFADLMARQKL
jgi:NHLM bacteriocin system ABC transporter ATP-binding protein